MGYIICISIIALLVIILLLNRGKETRNERDELKRENEEIKRREEQDTQRQNEARQAKQDARTGDHSSDLNFIAHRLHKHATGDETGPADN